MNDVKRLVAQGTSLGCLAKPIVIINQVRNSPRHHLKRNCLMWLSIYCSTYGPKLSSLDTFDLDQSTSFLGGLSLHLNHLIA